MEDHINNSNETQKKKPRAALSFTGGKDCHLALYKASFQYEIACLVIFHPPNPEFKAHPISWQRKQANLLDIPLQLYCIDASKYGNDYKKSYKFAIEELKHDYNIDALITGDIDLLRNNSENFIESVCETIDNLKVELPLWKKSRMDLLEELWSLPNIQVVFTCVKYPLDSTWIGRLLDISCVKELEALNVDLSGENGEYHTMVLNCPMYKVKCLKLENIEATELENQKGQVNGVKWWVCSSNTRLAEESKITYE